MKKTIKLLLLMLFIVINGTIYFLTQINSQDKIETVLKDDLKHLTTHYEIFDESQKDTAYAIYRSILRNTDLMRLLENSYNESVDIQAKNRNLLHSQLVEQYETAKKTGDIATAICI